MSFTVLNGVKQGGIVSPIMFCVYFDKLLLSLAESGVGCYIGRYFVGALAYADDIVLLAPNSMRKMLACCDTYSSDYNVIFNANKSKRIFFPAKGHKRKLNSTLVRGAVKKF